MSVAQVSPALQIFSYLPILLRRKKRIVKKRSLVARYGDFLYQDWFIEAKPTSFQVIAVNVLKILLKSVRLPK